MPHSATQAPGRWTTWPEIWGATCKLLAVTPPKGVRALRPRLRARTRERLGLLAGPRVSTPPRSNI
eukprot:5797813-Alexandrium_andersonii.AAC.1